jgi:hypothetical protein
MTQHVVSECKASDTPWVLYMAADWFGARDWGFETFFETSSHAAKTVRNLSSTKRDRDGAVVDRLACVAHQSAIDEVVRMTMSSLNTMNLESESAADQALVSG